MLMLLLFLLTLSLHTDSFPALFIHALRSLKRNIELHDSHRVDTDSRVLRKEWSLDSEYRNFSRNSSGIVDVLMTIDPDIFSSMSTTKRYLRRGMITVNSQITANTTTEVNELSTIQLLIRNEFKVYSKLSAILESSKLSNFSAMNDIQVVFEDDYLAVVNKPQHMPIFPTHSKDTSESVLTLQTALLSVLKPSVNTNTEVLHRPQPVHRLDAGTGGLVVVAKTKRMLTLLSELFANRQVFKRYRALVYGKLEGNGIITKSISGQSAHSQYSSCGFVSRISSTGDERRCDRENPSKEVNDIYNSSAGCSIHENCVSTVDIIIKTGRTHQIRRFGSNFLN